MDVASATTRATRQYDKPLGIHDGVRFRDKLPSLDHPRRACALRPVSAPETADIGISFVPVFAATALLAKVIDENRQSPSA